MTDRTTLILLALAEGPLHGYGIKRAVADRTDGAVKLGPGTLYEALQRLVESGWIREVSPPRDQAGSGGPPRRFYNLTPRGRRQLASELEHMEAIIQYAKSREMLS